MAKSMEDADILQVLASFVEEIGGVPASDVSLDSVLREAFDIDSLELLELALLIERHFGLALPEEIISELVEVRDVVAYIHTATLTSDERNDAAAGMT